jgi:hypothetical protein
VQVCYPEKYSKNLATFEAQEYQCYFWRTGTGRRTPAPFPFSQSLWTWCSSPVSHCHLFRPIMDLARLPVKFSLACKLFHSLRLNLKCAEADGRGSRKRLERTVQVHGSWSLLNRNISMSSAMPVHAVGHPPGPRASDTRCNQDRHRIRHVVALSLSRMIFTSAQGC